MNKKHNKQQGVALIGVLVIVALISASITFILDKQSELFTSTKLILEQNQALNYFYSIQSWAKSEINKDKTKDYDALDEDWAVEIPPIPVPGGTVSGRLNDIASKLNINNIIIIKNDRAKIRTKPDYNLCLSKLTTQLEIERIDDFIIDYINSQEDKKLFTHISDLKKVPGITSKIYQKLKPYLYAFETIEEINLNTADKKLIACLHQDLTEFNATEIISNRPFKNIASAKSVLRAQLSHLTSNQIDQYFVPLIRINTKYFELVSEIKIGDSHLKAKSILDRKSGKIITYLRNFSYQL